MPNRRWRDRMPLLTASIMNPAATTANNSAARRECGHGTGEYHHQRGGMIEIGERCLAMSAARCTSTAIADHVMATPLTVKNTGSPP